MRMKMLVGEEAFKIGLPVSVQGRRRLEPTVRSGLAPPSYSQSHFPLQRIRHGAHTRPNAPCVPQVMRRSMNNGEDTPAFDDMQQQQLTTPRDNAYTTDVAKFVGWNPHSPISHPGRTEVIG